MPLPIFPLPKPVPISPVLERVLDSREAGYVDGNNHNTSVEFIDWNSNDDFNFRDVVYGDGGYDYISTGGGNDKVVLDSNWGTWRGQGNEFGNAAIVEAGSGNDDVYIRGTEGAYHVVTGTGNDYVSVTGATQVQDYVRINAYDGTETGRDVFSFGANFNGDAEIWGVDTHDQLRLAGGDWHLANTSGGNVTYENSTGGSVTMTGITHGFNDPSVIFV